MAVNQLKAGAVLSYVSIGLNTLVGLIYTPFLLRMLGQNEFGLYSLVASIVAYLTVLDLGFGNAIVRYVAKFRAENKREEQYELVGMFFVIYCGIGLVAVILGALLYLNVNLFFDASLTPEDISKVKIMLLMLIFNLAFTFPMSIWRSILTAYEEFVFPKLLGIARIILNPIVMIILLYHGYKAIAMVALLTAFNVVTLCIEGWYCHHKVRMKLRFRRFKWDFLREVLIYSFWIFLTSIMDKFYYSTGQFILGVYSGATAIAIYALAIQLQHLYISFSSAISGVFLPKVTGMYAKGESSEAVSRLFIKTGRVQWLVISLVLTGFILFGQDFLRIWAGEGYGETYFVTLCLFIPASLPLIQSVGITILQAANKMKFRALSFVLISIVGFLLSIPLTQRYGVTGCVIGTSLSIIMAQGFAINIYYYKIMKINIPAFFKNIGKMSIGIIVFCVVCWFVLQEIHLRNLPLLVLAILIYTVCYGIVLWFTAMNDYERQLFMQPVAKIINKLRR